MFTHSIVIAHGDHTRITVVQEVIATIDQEVSDTFSRNAVDVATEDLSATLQLIGYAGENKHMRTEVLRFAGGEFVLIEDDDS